MSIAEKIARRKAAHVLKMAEKKHERAHRKRGHLTSRGNFYAIPDVEVATIKASVPGGLRRYKEREAEYQRQQRRENP